MTSNVYGHFISLADEDRADPGLSGAMLRDFALFADRASPTGEAKAKYHLSARAAVPTGPSPRGYALVAGEKAVTPADAWSRRIFYAALALALAIHLSFLAPFAFRPAASLRELGMEEGLPENLNVSVVSAADLMRLSSDSFLQDARPSPFPANAPDTVAPEEPQQPAPEAPEPQQRPVKEANAAPPSEPLFDEKPATYDPSGFIAKTAQNFSAQVGQAFNGQSRPEQPKRVARSAGNVRVMRPGATHSGKSDEFERQVIWALGATKPMGNGKWGSAVVTFVVSETGRLEDLRLIKSSGDNWLDTGVLMSVRQARLPTPAAGLTAGDRTFNVEYISVPY